MTLRPLQRAMARAVLPRPVADALGDITLLPHQQQAVARLLRTLRWYRGALLADDVGLGKTYSALAVARQYRHAHVLAPAGLRAMWQQALTRTRQHHITVHSLHAASHAVPALGPAGPDTLVIIDEAHALRNADTARYRHVASAVAGSHVLLLSATPLHNSPRDLSTMVGLFLGARRLRLKDEQLAQLVVRRDAVLLGLTPRCSPSVAGQDGEPPIEAARPPVVHRHRALVMPQHRATLDAILSLPAPMPARDGAVATALIKLGLLRAWCSSDAALTHAIMRRILRTEALRAALQSNRHPTQQELRAWAIGDDHMQLAFPELMASSVPTIAPPAQAVRQHLEALRALHVLHTGSAGADRIRGEALRRIGRAHPGMPIVAFSQYTKTVQALYRALSDIAGVGMIAGSTARIASGPLTRTELLEHFAPRAHGRPPPPPHRAVRLLLTTDLLAEGVNLQDAGVVVHLDLPWTAALEAQRVGRIVRIGSPHADVHVHRIAASEPLRRAVRVEARLARKLLLTHRHVGGTSHAHRATPITRASAADAQSAWFATLTRWACGMAPHVEPSAARIMGGEDAAHRAGGRWAVVRSPVGCAQGVPRTCAADETAESPHPHGAIEALVLVRLGTRCILLGVSRRAGGWRVSRRAAGLLQVGQLIDRAAGPLGARGIPATRTKSPGAAVSHAVQSDIRRTIRRVVRRWHARRVTAVLAGRETPVPASGLPVAAQRTAMHWLQRCVASLSAIERISCRQEINAARQCIEQARGAAALEALHQWMQEVRPRNGTEVSVAEQLRQWRHFEVLVRTAGSGLSVPVIDPSAAGAASAAGCVIVAVIAVTVEA